MEHTFFARAQAKDLTAIRSMVIAAYSKYTTRIGKLPAPLTTDYNLLITTDNVFILQQKTLGTDEITIVGSIVLTKDDFAESIKINNLVVDPALQGRGYGRILMQFAEMFAQEQGRHALTLFTNAKMHENLALYSKMGFEETGRAIEDGFERIYFRKALL